MTVHLITANDPLTPTPPEALLSLGGVVLGLLVVALILGVVIHLLRRPLRSRRRAAAGPPAKNRPTGPADRTADDPATGSH